MGPLKASKQTSYKLQLESDQNATPKQEAVRYNTQKLLISRWVLAYRDQYH